ncbi:MAG: PQQ-dependent sugar dehydrogenase [Phycisphaerales bacterium]
MNNLLDPLAAWTRNTSLARGAFALSVAGLVATLAIGRPAPAADTAASQDAIPSVRLVRVWPEAEIRRPTQILARPDREGSFVVLEQSGRIVSLDASNESGADATVFMDLTDRVNFGSNEEGMLSLAFHPKFAENGRLFAYYTAKSPRRVVISEFKLDESGTKGVPGSEKTILEIPQPFWNHNGGTLAFGPDGMLYAAIGDGGAAADPQGHGQNLGTLLASVVRIDVDDVPEGRAYGIPADNPFVDRAGARPEIWAYGLRNVWRMSFDRKTGDLWAGDVGQNKYEEIDLVVKGGNYGWNRREGFHPFGRADGPEPADPFLDPVVEYPRNEGVSVTGGHVYRGPAKALDGVYLYADYAMGTIWGLRRAADGSLVGPEVLVRRPGSLISSFGEANDGTLYITTFEGGERPGPGAIYRLDPIVSTASR